MLFSKIKNRTYLKIILGDEFWPDSYFIYFTKIYPLNKGFIGDELNLKRNKGDQDGKWK